MISALGTESDTSGELYFGVYLNARNPAMQHEMLSRDRMACCSLRDRDADITNSCDSNCEVRYKLVGFGRSGC